MSVYGGEGKVGFGVANEEEEREEEKEEEEEREGAKTWLDGSEKGKGVRRKVKKGKRNSREERDYVFLCGKS